MAVKKGFVAPRGKAADQDRKRVDPAVAGLLLLTLLMFVVRLYAAKTVGFGDSEALYACLLYTSTGTETRARQRSPFSSTS